jgi:hypothetical protein
MRAWAQIDSLCGLDWSAWTGYTRLDRDMNVDVIVMCSATGELTTDVRPTTALAVGGHRL